MSQIDSISGDDKPRVQVSRISRLRAVFRGLGPLAPAVGFFGVFLGLFAIVRMGLSVYYWPQLREVEDFILLLPVGLRMDIIPMSYVLFLPVLTGLLSPAPWRSVLSPILAVYFTSIGALFLFVEIASVPFLAEYSSRPNHIFFDYLAYPREVFGLLWADYKLALALAAVALYFGIRWMWRLTHLTLRNAPAWPVWRRLVALPVVVFLLFVGGRSGLGLAPPNPSLAIFSGNHLANQLALNSFYSLAFSVYMRSESSVDAETVYGNMPRDEVLRRVRKDSLLPASAFYDGANPTLHVQPASVTRDKRPNLVLILEESLGGDMVGALGGKSLTPNLDRLVEDGIFFTNLFAVGTRTARGLEAMVSGYLPLANASLLKLPDAQHGFFTLAGLLRQNGYHTAFMYGGESHFDNMAGFLVGNGVQQVIDEDDFESPVFRNAWGVSDEDLFAKANEVLREQREPFFYTLLTLTNHRPYQFPDGRIDLIDQPKEQPVNSARYADYALGKFFEQAKREAYFDNTIFVIVADHPMHARGDLVPVEHFRIPALIIGPGIAPRKIATVSSQIDLLPTVLGLLGIEAAHPMIGRDLLNLPAGAQGRALIRYNDAYAYRREDQVVVYHPHRPPEQFRVINGKLAAMEIDEDLARDGLATLLLSGLLYSEQAYGLPVPASSGKPTAHASNLPGM